MCEGFCFLISLPMRGTNFLTAKTCIGNLEREGKPLHHKIGYWGFRVVLMVNNFFLIMLLTINAKLSKLRHHYNLSPL